MVQIYMEKILDLLDPSKTDLVITEDLHTGTTIIKNQSEQYVSDEEETFELLELAISNLKVAWTEMN